MSPNAEIAKNYFWGSSRPYFNGIASYLTMSRVKIYEVYVLQVVGDAVIYDFVIVDFFLLTSGEQHGYRREYE